ncbi:hypothetical protein A2966_05085 [Candidatus Roizmanbacteria bacterium RIFCSPLOWO2_01_FULL_41_22]|uniref:AAA+ ATPase domain-containing protein n=1 Tax=Candidatus Roizmanbacteria bacterium RIFCSPLOWO2_01_FULL_41_22 TaxID=1802067 RepID=A0A1F7J7X3_9BACT|nr:MAG: hypothetical protein A2966_05085 [Candidatus Roizmanbacteria bacterium RIFCSPLOWO2_01_FULL_41_22]
MIPRLIEPVVLEKAANYDKIILILGARQVGKTTLIQSLTEKLAKKGKRFLYLNCDLEEDRQALDTTSLTVLRNITAGVDYLCIDEAQRLNNPGLTLKIIHDNFKSTKIIATGSSAFELKNKLSDALTGRYLDFHLYALSFLEVINASQPPHKALLKNIANSILNQTLTYGLYPEVHLAKKETDKKLYLEKIGESYLFKDILTFQGVRNTKAIRDLTRAIAYQIGSLVSENELANRVKIDRKTVASYLDILEKSYIIIRVYPYSANPRREIGKNYKIYFTDLGLRNSLIGDFNRFELRQDNGRVWENFLILERLKSAANCGQTIDYHFWRSYSGAEVDYLEKDPSIKAYEFKLSEKAVSRSAAVFVKTYQTPVQLVNKENYLDFISRK